MTRALQLAVRGEGLVEPNPMVGCVLVKDDRVIGEGWHARFGGSHAEVEAIASVGDSAAITGATAYVTLEPCSHFGKTPPCAQALIDARVARVVIAITDPNPQVDGQGVAALTEAGIDVVIGVSSEQAERVLAPFRKLTTQRRPWVHAKWAMSLDGRIATRTGSSKWISSDRSREIVHALRGRVDAIVVGRGTVEHDDPLLTARPAGPRTATRVVLDSIASLASDSRLVIAVDEAPVLLAAGPNAPEKERQRLRDRGVEVLSLDEADHGARMIQLLEELGRRQMTNVLFEGGAEVFGVLHDHNLIDEVHAFVAPRLIGGNDAAAAFAGRGVTDVKLSTTLCEVEVQSVGDDLYVRGRTPPTA